MKMCEDGECPTALRLNVSGREPASPQELLIMEASGSGIVTFAIIDVDSVKAVGVNDSETLRSRMRVRATESRRMA
jgi:hypothetical protein